MHSAVTNSRTKARLNISDVGPRVGSTKLAAAVRGALTLAVLSALLIVAARPAQAQTETVLYNFTGGSDGFDPGSGLTPDGAGTFYGTTYGGGQGYGWSGYGTVFELSPSGSGGWNETVLYSFTGGADGSQPSYSGVIFDRVGNLYGTTYSGGANGYGVVFELSPVGGGWTETVLYSFAGGTDGAGPVSSLIMDRAGNLYGTTWNSSGGGTATVFELSPSGGGWTEQVIYATNTGFADAGLTMDDAGNIYGATASTVFELSPNGHGGWNPTVIHTFAGPKDGRAAEGTPVLDKAGNLYGTTTAGGAKGNGTVYKLSPGKKGWKEKILYSFKGGKKDGSDPFAGVVLDAAGNIYGVTEYGVGNGAGAVYELVAPVGAGSYKEKILWSFNYTDGSQPYYPLILDGGNLYGTASFGGSNSAGVVFEVTP